MMFRILLFLFLVPAYVIHAMEKQDPILAKLKLIAAAGKYVYAEHAAVEDAACETFKQLYSLVLEKKYDELARQLTNLHQRVEAIKTVYQQHSTAPDRTVLETMEMAQRRYLLWALKIPSAEIPLNTWRIFSRICLRKADHEHGLLKKAQSAKEQFRAHGESVLLDKNVAALAFCVVLPTFE